MFIAVIVKDRNDWDKMYDDFVKVFILISVSVSTLLGVKLMTVKYSSTDVKINTVTKPKNETWVVRTNKTLVGEIGELEVYSGSTLSEPKVTPLEVTYKDKAGEVDHIVKYKRVSTRTTIFGSFKTEETVYKLK